MDTQVQAVTPGPSGFTYCLNTSTVKGQKLSLPELIRVTAEAGYDGIEPWVCEIDAFVAGGGDLAELNQRFADAGLAVENLIGFFEWGVNAADRRAAGLAEARRCFELARAVGARRVAAPPSGLTECSDMDLLAVAGRYADVLRLGREFGVVPVVEFWGMSKTLSRLGEAILVAVESGHPDACVLADVFHIYKSGGSHAGIALAGPKTIGLVHMNDYPAQPGRDAISDAERVYPGDGIAPLGTFLQDLAAAGYRGPLSLELFNPAYWQAEALSVARTGLRKMTEAVTAALG